ncbi:ATP-binding protein [Microtetraspora niveoalba]|uniref:ATP-binding protein n=1 Tax=Microtetraspora niveoalba TaxID=46175 RepID=UPI000836F9A4|nr:ATP-binding protein [Microtetraspora niveoalba]
MEKATAGRTTSTAHTASAGRQGPAGQAGPGQRAFGGQAGFAGHAGLCGQIGFDGALGWGGHAGGAACGAVTARAAICGRPYAPGRPAPVLGEKWIPPDGRCLASARRFVRDVAADWEAAQDVPEVAELLASELVTNAITHGAQGVPAASTIRISVCRERELIVVEVHDSCFALPRPRRAGDLDIGGRGLAIVRTFAHGWGWTPTPYGKSVWFQLLAWPP